MDEFLLKEIQANFSTTFPKAYFPIRDSYLLILYGKYDRLREEICKCVTFGLFQASITLTNHLLELLLKDSLIFHHSQVTKFSSAVEDQQKLAAAVERFDNMVLEKTIKESHLASIIDDEEKKQLNSFRKIFRNAYVHAEKGKLFGEDTIPIAVADLNDPETIEHSTPKIRDLIFLHGDRLQQKASRDAIPYFLYVDKILVREEMKRYPEIKDRPDFHRRKFNFKIYKLSLKLAIISTKSDLITMNN